MTIAVLSGKGGTGKTLLSVNLAAISEKAVYLDCDVEEPNGHLFFCPENTETEEVNVKIPYVDESLCSGCRICVEFCNFNALAFVKNKPMLFDEVCHSCGGCSLICPENAMREKDKQIGCVRTGRFENVKVATGIMNPGQASGVPIIKRLLQEIPDKGYTFIDCPPGSACIVMESIADADFCVMVAEPTLFGVHNLAMIHELVKKFNKPYGVVLNKCQDGENPAEEYCEENGVEIIGRIPFDRELGDINSRAMIAAKESNKYRQLFKALLERILSKMDGLK